MYMMDSCKPIYKLASIYGALLVVTCLILGLIHMFARAVTLDSVRGIDYQLVSSALVARGVGSESDQNFFYDVTDNLAAASGYAFYPLAMMDENSCIENNQWPRLCLEFQDSSVLREKMHEGEVIQRYGVDILQTENGRYFYVGDILDSDAWLIGGAGKYLFSGDTPFGQEWKFFSDIGELMDSRNLVKMAEKSLWTWTFSFALFVSAFSWHFLTIRNAEKNHHNLRENNQKIEIELASRSDDITRLSHEKYELELRIVNNKGEAEEEFRMACEELEVKELEISQVVEARNKLGMERDELADKMRNNWAARQYHLQKKSAEEAFNTLHDIKKLWLTGPDWSERHAIEKTLAAHSLKRAPFTEFIAFVRMEWFLKTMCELKRIYDVGSNEERINALRDKGFISKVNAALLHEVRRARNLWFHEGVSPDRSLIERLLVFLEGQKNPRIRPEI